MSGFLSEHFPETTSEYMNHINKGCYRWLQVGAQGQVMIVEGIKHVANRFLM
jgi:hypothetical protein